MAMDYNKTINLPKTDFPMRAGLPKREPEMLERWKKIDVYHALLKKNEGKPRPEQGPQGFHHPQLCHAGLLHALYPRLG